MSVRMRKFPLIKTFQTESSIFEIATSNFLVPGDIGNPKQYFDFCLGVQMQEP